MQEKTPLIILALFLFFGIFLLEGGMTGVVVSESTALITPQDNNALVGVGLLIIIISTALAFGYLKRHVNKMKEEENR